MAWGKAKTQPPLRSTITQLLPLIITLVVLSVVGWVCYQIYMSLIKIKAQAEKQMGENNVVFTKDGLRVNMKDVRTESYLDATQSWFVKAWDLSGNAVDKSKRKRNVLTKQRSPDISNQSNTF